MSGAPLGKIWKISDLFGLGGGRVFLHRLNAVFCGGVRIIHFAFSDGLAVGGFEDEIGLIRGGGFNPKVFVVTTVFLDRCDAVFSRAFGIVELAGKNDLVVASFKIEHEFAIGGLLEFVGHGDRFLMDGIAFCERRLISNQCAESCQWGTLAFPKECTKGCCVTDPRPTY